MIAGIAWSDEPPGDQTPWVPILSPKAGETLQAVSLDSSILGVLTHFFSERTLPCYLDKALCQGCQHGLARRWKGYLSGWQASLGRFVLLEITRQAFERARRTLSTIMDLRGYLVSITRQGRARNGSCVVDFRSWCLPEDKKLPRSFDAKGALMRIWQRSLAFPPSPPESQA